MGAKGAIVTNSSRDLGLGRHGPIDLAKYAVWRDWYDLGQYGWSEPLSCQDA
jgi:hypothetical protein